MEADEQHEAWDYNGRMESAWCAYRAVVWPSGPAARCRYLPSSRSPAISSAAMKLRRGGEGWRSRVQAVLPDAQFAPPATDEQMDAAEAELGQPLPPVLRDLLRETNGVRGDAYGLDLVWDVDRIQRDNLYFRRNTDFADLYMPFTPLLFFGDAGNGDQFAFVRQPCRDDDIYAWNHEDDSRTWVAPRLTLFFEWWVDGTIRL